MKTIVIDGASASSSDVKLESVVYNETRQKSTVIRHSLFKRRTMRGISSAVKTVPEDESIVFVAKSQGAWRLLNWLKMRADEQDSFRFWIITIDPHHWFFGSLPIVISHMWSVTNIIQTNYPAGAEVYGDYKMSRVQNEILTSPLISHDNIIYSLQVRRAIGEVVKSAKSRDLLLCNKR